ncbi:MAG: flagellar export chaperone FliS [candidate division Zixibacteria bacterium]|nr:flagellar export chaperone FliS [candidate division Zixibacteria bacterium]
MEGNLKTYRDVETVSKSQIDLILQVYDGAIKAYNQAADYYKVKDFDKGYEQLERSKRFITHLYTTLDEKKGGEVAANLGKLYAFLLNQTDFIQGTKDLKALDDNINIISELRLGWQGLKDQGIEGQNNSDKSPNPGSFRGSA